MRGLAYPATASWFDDGRRTISEQSQVKFGADVNAKDAAIALSLALQNGADVEVIREALCCESQGRASGPLGAALDRLVTD